VSTLVQQEFRQLGFQVLMVARKRLLAEVAVVLVEDAERVALLGPPYPQDVAASPSLTMRSCSVLSSRHRCVCVHVKCAATTSRATGSFRLCEEEGVDRPHLPWRIER
jgi:hypothetical protein